MPNLMKQREEALEAIKAANTMDELTEAKAALDAVDGQIALAEQKSALMAQLGAKGAAPVEVKGAEAPAKSLGDHFVKFRAAHPSADNRIIATPFKTAGDPTTTANLVATEYDREPVRRVAAPLTVLDLFGRKTISAPIYSWNVYSSTTGSVGTTSEGSTENKVTYNYVPKTATLQKVTGLIKVTDELFEDAPYMVDAINQDLVDDLNANRQTQALTTLLATSGLQTKSVTYANAIDIFKGILDAAAAVEDTTHIPADAVVVTPAIWLLLRSAVNEDGDFYAGSPFSDSEYKRLFEMTFVKDANMTANHLVVGAFARGAELVAKVDGVRVESTNSNDVDFEKNLITVRAEAREILAVKRPGCFCNVTLTADPS